MWPRWAIEGTQVALEITNATMEMVTPSSKGEEPTTKWQTLPWCV